MSRVLVVLADGFEEIEAVTPIDVLRRAGVDVVTMGIGSKTIHGGHGIHVITDTDTSSNVDAETFDGIVFPGGMPGATNIAASETISTLTEELYSNGKLIAAICASPGVVLGKTYILDGKRFTCYPGFEDRVEKGTFTTDRVVLDGNVITSRGPGSALEFSMALVRYLVSDEEAERLSKVMLLP